tara:strand:- start:17984 stop:19048 length:1065 start_codon:yes stop_codon:yes gene_type:complete
MDYLVLSYNSIYDINIGDYIQSLAAIQYIKPSKYKLVDREKLNLYSGKESILFMNCWYTSEPKSFPPSNNITPLFISFHLNRSVSSKILSVPENISYFKKYQPIGCRDLFTADLLESYGIKSYFSGCLTTTLSKTYKQKIFKDEISVVDIISTLPCHKNLFCKFSSYCSLLFFSIKNFSNIQNVINSLKHNCPISISNFKNLFFYYVYAARTFQVIKSIIHKNNYKKIKYYTHIYDRQSMPTDSERFAFADKLLRIYSKSSLILSSRLHCLLPSLGFGVPSIYFNQIKDNELSSCRKKGLIELFNKVDLNFSKVIYNPFGKIKNISKIKNKTLYQKYSKKIEKTINTFINEKAK